MRQASATQLTLEFDRESFPINKPGWQKESQIWFMELRRLNIAAHVLGLLHRFVSERHVPAQRAKKAAACLLWISDRPMSAIESALMWHGGKFDRAAGPVRSVSSRSCDLLPYVARVAAILHPELDLAGRVQRLLSRLGIGAPASAVEIALHAGAKLTRGDYQQLAKAGLGTAVALDAAPDDMLLSALGGNAERVEVAREAARLFHRQDPALAPPLLPEYEG
jgi:hypothetical protein